MLYFSPDIIDTSFFSHVRSIESITNLEKIEMSATNHIYNVMKAIGRGICSCHSECEILARTQEMKEVLPKTHERLAEVTANLGPDDPGIITEQKLYLIIKHFQKFMAYIMEPLPSWKYFFVALENLMIYELAKVVAINRPNYICKNQLVIPNKLWCLQSDPNMMHQLRESYQDKAHSVETMTICSTPEDSGLLFAKNVKVREDFRQMVRRGLEKTEEHELWNYRYEFGCEKITAQEVLRREMDLKDSDLEEKLDESHLVQWSHPSKTTIASSTTSNVSLCNLKSSQFHSKLLGIFLLTIPLANKVM